jgi:hypothetical protein
VGNLIFCCRWQSIYNADARDANHTPNCQSHTACF